MKITYFDTFIGNEQLLGSDFTSIYRNLDTQRKIDNAMKKHILKLSTKTNIHPRLKGNYTIKYNSIYK